MFKKTTYFANDVKTNFNLFHIKLLTCAQAIKRSSSLLPQLGDFLGGRHWPDRLVARAFSLHRRVGAGDPLVSEATVSW